MERPWCLFCHWPTTGNCHQQDPAVFHVCIRADHGLPHYPVYGPCLFPECPEIHDGFPPQSLVLSLIKDSVFTKKRPYPCGYSPSCFSGLYLFFSADNDHAVLPIITINGCGFFSFQYIDGFDLFRFQLIHFFLTRNLSVNHI